MHNSNPYKLHLLNVYMFDKIGSFDGALEIFEGEG